MLAFDATYLTVSLASMELHSKRAMVGGVWSPDDPGNSFVELREDLNVSEVKKSSSIMEFLTWNPFARKKSPLSVAAVPVEHSFSGVNSGYRGNLYVCSLVGQVCAENNGVLKGLICDSHGTHQFCRKLLHGQTLGLPMDDISQIPFFKDLRYQPLPSHPLPRLPIRLCLHHGEYIWGIPGVCDRV